MKKYLFPLALVSALTISACGSSSDETGPAESADVDAVASEDTPDVEDTPEAEETPAVTDEQVDEWAKSVIGFGADTSWQDAAAQGAPSWAWAVNSVTYGKGGNVVFNMQLDRTGDKDVAESITNLYANSVRLSPPEFADDISYIIVENGVGEHMDQERI